MICMLLRAWLSGCPLYQTFECNVPGNKTNMNKIWGPFFESCSNFTSPKMGQFYHSPLTTVLMSLYLIIYMEELLVCYRPTRTLRSADKGLLVTELFHTHHGIPYQSVYAHDRCELNTFKSKIKTFLFKHAFQL